MKRLQHPNMFFEIIQQIRQKSKETFCFEIKIEILNELIFVLECSRMLKKTFFM